MVHDYQSPTNQQPTITHTHTPIKQQAKNQITPFNNSTPDRQWKVLEQAFCVFMVNFFFLGYTIQKKPHTLHIHECQDIRGATLKETLPNN